MQWYLKKYKCCNSNRVSVNCVELIGMLQWFPVGRGQWHHMEDYWVSDVCPMRMLVWAFFKKKINEQVYRSALTMIGFCNFQRKCSDFWLSFAWERMKQTAANSVESPVHTTSPVDKLRFPLEKTKGYMSGMSTLLSLLLLQWAQFLPFWNAKSDCL